LKPNAIARAAWLCAGSVGCLLRARIALGLWLAFAAAHAGAAGTDGAGDGVSFFVGKTRLWLGRSQIVCFQLAQPATEDRYFPFQVDEKILHLLIPPRVLKGESIGYLRVEPLHAGTTSIGVVGAKLEVEIAPDPAIRAIAELQPRIVSPASGANVWGSFVVGVEQMSLGDPGQIPMPVLLLPNGKKVSGHTVPDQRPGPHARWVYELNASDLVPGPNRLIAVEKDGAGLEQRSNAIDVDVVQPDAGTLLSGLCRDQISGDRPAIDGSNPPPIINDEKYGQGMVCNTTSEAWCLPVWITKPGRYQMMVTARGDFGNDGPGTLGLTVDEDNQQGTTVRLATTEWQRIPVGHPFTLQPGGHIISVRLRNAFAEGAEDVRNLYLQKYELAAIDAPGNQLASVEGGQETMMSMAPAGPGGGGATEGLQVAFTDNLDGQMVTGTVEADARCWGPDSDHTPPPRVELYVNQKLFSTQSGKNPHFTIDPAAFIAGPNTLELRAVLPSGSWAESVPLTVEVPPDFPLSKTPDKIPPRVSIAYAPKTCAAGKTDAVVARVLDNKRVAGADLVIDDQPQHLDETPRHGLGPVVFPLLTRDLAPGRHRLKVIAHDDAGNSASSAEISFTISNSGASGPSRYERAVFLTNRFGYGPEPGEIAAILTMGEKPWLESRLTEGLASPAEANEQEAMRASFPNERDNGQVITGAVEYLLSAPNPVRARFLVWTENHFSTWINKDGAPAKGHEHKDFLQLGVVPFFDLLFTSATSPAMLVYLDQRQSYAHRLNENYAREIMELHTLGVHGGYTQKDVTQLANLLTGWTLIDEAPEDGSAGDLEGNFGYDPTLNVKDACRVLGLEFPGVEPEERYDRVLMALEMLTAHPSCATFISRKLCEQYVSDPAPPKLVADLAKVFLETGGDMSAMLLAMEEHPDFWAAERKVASPIDFGVRTSRMAGSLNPGPVNDLISASGMGMFDRATPDGYPEDNGYSMNSNIMLQRWRFAKVIQDDFLRSGLVPNAWKPADAGWTPAVTQRIIDLSAARMTGNVLTAASNDAALKLLTDAPANTDARLHALATLICQLPESSLR
jgi:uncharacterized protein (DUF1800 family)